MTPPFIDRFRPGAYFKMAPQKKFKVTGNKNVGLILVLIFILFLLHLTFYINLGLGKYEKKLKNFMRQDIQSGLPKAKLIQAIVSVALIIIITVFFRLKLQISQRIEAKPVLRAIFNIISNTTPLDRSE